MPQDFSAQGPVEHLICQHQEGSKAKPAWKGEESRHDMNVSSSQKRK